MRKRGSDTADQTLMQLLTKGRLLRKRKDMLVAESFRNHMTGHKKSKEEEIIEGEDLDDKQQEQKTTQKFSSLN